MTGNDENILITSMLIPSRSFTGVVSSVAVIAAVVTWDVLFFRGGMFVEQKEVFSIFF